MGDFRGREKGFVLLARSELNANPRDTKNHPRGVWTLPPSMAMKEQDKKKYEAIGESDRMTLLFKTLANELHEIRQNGRP